MSCFFFPYWSPSSSLCTVFASISSNIDEVLSINPSTNVFVFGDLRTGLPVLVELIDLVNSAIIFLPQVTLFRWLTFLLRSQTMILIVLIFWISSDASIYSTMTYPPLGNSDHVVASVSIDFPSNSQQDALYLMPYDYSCADCDGLCDHLRYVPWEDVIKLSVSATASEFCEWAQIGIDVYVSHRKYQAKPHSSPWFSAACAAAINHRNHFFCFYQKDKCSDFKVMSRQASDCWKRVLEATKLAYTNKNFSNNSNLDDSGISFPVFPS